MSKGNSGVTKMLAKTGRYRQEGIPAPAGELPGYIWTPPPGSAYNREKLAWDEGGYTVGSLCFGP
jgi:hypothetical protein